MRCPHCGKEIGAIIDISGIDKALILKALYDRAHPRGMGFLDHVPGDISIEKCRELLEKQSYFDYLNGRPLKIDLSGNKLNAALYDRDNGVMAAETAILSAMED